MKLFFATASVLVLFVTGDALSTVYKWEDDRGVVGFTEDLGKIPQKYRKKARILGQDQIEGDAAIIVDDTGSAKSTKESPRSPKDGTGISTTEKLPKKKLFGGKDESYWLNQFGKLKADLRSYKDQLDAINARLANTGQMSRSEYKSLENTRKLLEEQEGSAKKKLESLTQEAGKAGVPPDLR